MNKTFTLFHNFNGKTNFNLVRETLCTFQISGYCIALIFFLMIYLITIKHQSLILAITVSTVS